MKQLSIFDLPDDENRLEAISEEEIAEQFAILQQIFKENSNVYFMGLSDLPQKVRNCVNQFEKNGWIEKRGSGINILDPYLKHYSPEEIAAIHQDRLDKALENPDVSWYETVLPVVNWAPTPIRYKSDEMRLKTGKLIDEVTKNAAMKLGLKHFLEVPSSRGSKTNSFPSKWAIKNVLPMITEKIIPIEDINEMEDFFHYHVFFMGRRDWDKKGYHNNYQIPPYPEFKRLMPSVFDIACLCEATDAKTIRLILEYSGSCYGYFETEKEGMIYLYPEGWSYERYESTLSEEDKQLIKKDGERLKMLHGHKY